MPGVADQAGGSRSPRHRYRARPRREYCSLPATMPHHTLRILVVLRTGGTGHKRTGPPPDRAKPNSGSPMLNPMSTSSTRPHSGAASTCTGLSAPNVTVTSAVHRRAVHCAGVRLDAARKIDRHDRWHPPGRRDRPRQAVDRRARKSRRCRRSPDPATPTSAATSAAGLQESIEARPMSARRIEQHGPHAHTSFAEQTHRPTGHHRRCRPYRPEAVTDRCANRPCTGNAIRPRLLAQDRTPLDASAPPSGKLVEQRRLSCSHLIGCVVPHACRNPFSCRRYPRNHEITSSARQSRVSCSLSVWSGAVPAPTPHHRLRKRRPADPW